MQAKPDFMRASLIVQKDNEFTPAIQVLCEVSSLHSIRGFNVTKLCDVEWGRLLVSSDTQSKWCQDNAFNVRKYVMPMQSDKLSCNSAS